jgi:ABC-type nitrate/sulfonate/bicarbonate transport system substrate-binding protein
MSYAALVPEPISGFLISFTSKENHVGSSRIRRLALGTAVIAVLAPALAACSSSGDSGGSGATSAIRVVEYPGSDISWLAYVAQQKGYFSTNNIKVTFTQLPAGQQGTAALVGRSVDIAVLDTNNLAPLLAQGQKFTLLVNAVTNFWVLVGNKSLAREPLQQVITGLRGKSVNVPSVAGTGAQQVLALAKAYGLGKSDVHLVADPTNAALTSGKVQASMTDEIGACRLTAEGYPEAMDFINPPASASSYPAAVRQLIGLAGLGYWSSSSWASAHKAAVTGFQKSIEQAAAWAKAPGNQAALATMLRKSSYNLPSLNGSQWSSCVKQIASSFNNAYTPKDTATWAQIVKQEGLASGLPPASQWQAAGLPK